jgi:hypothetical protein
VLLRLLCPPCECELSFLADEGVKLLFMEAMALTRLPRLPRLILGLLGN